MRKIVIGNGFVRRRSGGGFAVGAREGASLPALGRGLRGRRSGGGFAVGARKRRANRGAVRSGRHRPQTSISANEPTADPKIPKPRRSPSHFEIPSGSSCLRAFERSDAQNRGVIRSARHRPQTSITLDEPTADPKIPKPRRTRSHFEIPSGSSCLRAFERSEAQNRGTVRSGRHRPQTSTTLDEPTADPKIPKPRRSRNHFEIPSGSSCLRAFERSDAQNRGVIRSARHRPQTSIMPNEPTADTKIPKTRRSRNIKNGVVLFVSSWPSCCAAGATVCRLGIGVQRSNSPRSRDVR